MATIFKNINLNEQKKLLKSLEMSKKLYLKNQTIPTMLSDEMIGIVLRGSIEISKTDYNGNKIIVEELYENGFIEKAFLNNRIETQIITKEDTEILFFEYQNILNNDNINTKTYITFIKNLLEISNELIREKSNKIDILSKKTIRDKLLEYFNIESKKFGSRKIYLPFTYTDLADFLSVDRSAMSRELSNLKKEGFIETKGRIIKLIEH